jgi:two-component system sensor histidine kinase KdpD
MNSQDNIQQPSPLPELSTAGSGAARGRLRIYFGASSGVGKTHAMLDAARKLVAEGKDVAIGAIHPRGCEKIGGLCEGLERIPARRLENGLAEFDLDAALARRPAILIADDLVHINGQGARHPKRWQDVEELLDAGIDVFTTVNVQNLESLNNVVGDIIGRHVAETVPDTVFDGADEIVLVDLPVDELYARIAAVSKRHRGHTADAMSKGELIALRELALRRMAERVEDDVRAYRIEKADSPVWKTDAALLACIGPHADEHVVRSAARLANQLNVAWHAVYVETPALQRAAAAQRERILQTVKLAQDLGATASVLPGDDIAATLAGYMRANNLSKCLLGRSRGGWGKWFGPDLRERIADSLPGIDLIEIGDPTALLHAPAGDASRADVLDDLGSVLSRPPSRLRRYAIAALASLATAAVSMPLLQHVDLANIAMLYVLTVVLVAVRYGRGASVVATLVGVLAFIALMPKFSFAASNLEYSVTFLVMLAVGLITGKLTSDLRYQVRVAAHRESRAIALFKFARALSGTLETEQIVAATRDFVRQTFHCAATIFLPDGAGRLHPALSATSNEAGASAEGDPDVAVAQWAFDHSAPAGQGTDTSAHHPFFYLPLIAPMRTRGILALSPESARWLSIPEQRRQLDTFAALAAIALERVHYVEVARDVLVKMESEKLRNSLLAAISHDLRTPLTSLVGLSESLARSKPPLSSLQLDLADALRGEALRMSNLVSNLLEMARIQSGQIRLDLQWQPIEEVVGSALRASRPHLGARQIRVALPQDLPIVRFDAVLMERVLCNLLENASKYTPPNAQIAITAQAQADFLEVAVSDNGPGLPAGQEEAIFEKFTRGDNESAIPGMGLGLAICRAIVEAHGGKIRALTAASGGASFVFTIPLGAPPDISSIEETESSSAS